MGGGTGGGGRTNLCVVGTELQVCETESSGDSLHKVNITRLTWTCKKV